MIRGKEEKEQRPGLTWEADFLGLKPSCLGEQAGEVVLPEEAEPLPLSVNQEKGRKGELPVLPEPSTDSLWRKHPAWCGCPGEDGSRGWVPRVPLTCCPWTGGCYPSPCGSCWWTLGGE